MTCIHCTEEKENPVGEHLAFCEINDSWMNVTLGECFGNCESEDNRRANTMPCDGCINETCKGCPYFEEATKDGEQDGIHS